MTTIRPGCGAVNGRTRAGRRRRTRMT
jgi:hypothetical protein